MGKTQTFQLPHGTLYPVLPLRDIVVFPHMVVPLFVGRDKSVKALESGLEVNKEILLLTQKSASQEEPTASDLYSIGTIATVLQLLRLPDGTVKVLIEGLRRAQVMRFSSTEDFFEAYAEVVEDVLEPEVELEALMRTAVTQFDQYVKLNKKVPQDIFLAISQIQDPSKLADAIAAHLLIKINEKQDLLEIQNIAERLEKVCAALEGEIDVMQAEQ